MPITPFHIIAASPIKAIAPEKFKLVSWHLYRIGVDWTLLPKNEKYINENKHRSH